MNESEFVVTVMRDNNEIPTRQKVDMKFSFDIRKHKTDINKYNKKVLELVFRPEAAPLSEVQPQHEELHGLEEHAPSSRTQTLGLLCICASSKCAR